VKRVVVDAGVLLAWFDAESPHRALRAEYEAGTLAVVGPPELVAEAMGDLARRTGWREERLAIVGSELVRLGIQLQAPQLQDLAHWLAKGLTPSSAACAALAARLEVPLVSDDPDLRRAASDLLQR